MTPSSSSGRTCASPRLDDTGGGTASRLRAFIAPTDRRSAPQDGKGARQLALRRRKAAGS